jgi:superfamily I DNA/RNA helicase
MSCLIIVDEPSLKEIVESNLYQSRHFEAGEALAHAISGDTSIAAISPRVIPIWRRGNIYLLQSRVETGYLIFDSAIFESLPDEAVKDGRLDDMLLVFQRVCRFTLKEWNRLSFSFSEIWSAKTNCGVVFPFPKSKRSDYRVSLKKGELSERLSTRHGSRQMFAFAAGEKDVSSTTVDQERAYRRLLEELTAVRTSVDAAIRVAESQRSDIGFHPLVLTNVNPNRFVFQAYKDWMPRLTIQQRQFVESTQESPQRVEGPAGTGKTLCLLLRSYFLCKRAEELGEEFRVLLVAHSDATRDSTATILEGFGAPQYNSRKRADALQSIELCTLQEWCAQLLGTREISSAQYLDQDALQAKELRKLIIKDVVTKRRLDDRQSLDYLTTEFQEFFENENSEYIAELLQHEIGVMIKGRASENLEAYLNLPSLTYCLPTKSPSDRRFVYSLYIQYQADLNLQGVYDTDDIVLSALGRLDTPIWRRRRAIEGFDAVVIDETHLFNFNELAVFHHLVRNPERPRIVFSIDRSQAPGERGITGRLIREVLTQSATEEELETRTRVVFRCAPNVLKLAEAITHSATTLFTTFENPLLNATSVITASDEEMAGEAIYWKCSNDELMAKFSVTRAVAIKNLLKCPASEVLVVAAVDSLLPILRQAFTNRNEKHLEILQRGDTETVRRGAKENAFIVSHPDYVGGLEFKAVLIVGVDEGRVPPSDGAVRIESKHFVEFKACNRMYVAISRARLLVEMLYSAERGQSSLLRYALATSVITEKVCPGV